jgi:hypothetical protein
MKLRVWMILLAEALLVAALLTALPAQAQRCAPKTALTPGAPGSNTVLFSDATGAARCWMCPSTPGTAVARCYAGLWRPDLLAAATAKIATAADPWAQFDVEMREAGVAPAGSVEACQVKRLEREACMRLYVDGMPGWIPPTTAADAATLGKCGPSIDCTPPPAWVVDAATSADGTRPAYPFSAGVRGEVATGRALAGQPCRPEIAQAPSLTAGTVWAAYGPQFSPAMLARCRRP